MPGHLGAVAAGRHVAPLAPTGPRGVAEDPAALLVGADPQLFGVALAHLARHALGQARQGAGDGIALVLVVERHAIVGGDQVPGVVRAQRPVDLVEVALRGRAVTRRRRPSAPASQHGRGGSGPVSARHLRDRRHREPAPPRACPSAAGRGRGTSAARPRRSRGGRRLASLAVEGVDEREPGVEHDLVPVGNELVGLGLRLAGGGSRDSMVLMA